MHQFLESLVSFVVVVFCLLVCLFFKSFIFLRNA